MFYSEEVNLGHFGGTTFRVWWNLTLSKPVSLYPRILYIVINAFSYALLQQVTKWLANEKLTCLASGVSFAFCAKNGECCDSF